MSSTKVTQGHHLHLSSTFIHSSIQYTTYLETLQMRHDTLRCSDDLRLSRGRLRDLIANRQCSSRCCDLSQVFLRHGTIVLEKKKL